MAVPKRRHSKSRKSKKQSHQGLPKPSKSICPNCSEAKAPHEVCPHCGHYKDRMVIEIEEV